MGRVFLVRDRDLERELALKLLHARPSAPADLEQVQSEFALLAKIEHPGIAKAYDFGYLRGLPYYTREFIPGESLGERRGIEDPDELLRISRGITEPLAFLHSARILHLDLKPSNVILPQRPAGASAVLIDFGLFRWSPQSGGGTGIRGSLPFLAPERFAGGDAGPWSDVYSLGVTLYVAATGSFPRDVGSASDAEARCALDRTPSPAPPSQMNPTVPRDLDGVILRCLALDPRSRFGSGQEVLEALDRISGRSRARAIDLPPPPSTVGRRGEIERLRELVHHVLERDGSVQALLMTGPSGMGQTHLFTELKLSAQTGGAHVALETGYPGRATLPAALFGYLSAHMDPQDRACRERWEAFLSRCRRPRSTRRSDTSEGERRSRRAVEVSIAARRVRDPLILAVDGLQHFDEVSIALLTDLLRALEETPEKERPPIGFVLGYREEGSARSLLRELTEVIRGMARGDVITLCPLGLEETLELHASQGGEPARQRGLALLQETGGSPARIVSLARGRSEAKGAGMESPGKPPSRSPGVRAADAILVLGLLGRPVGEAELRRMTGNFGAHSRRVLGTAREQGLVRETEPGSGDWLATDAGRELVEAAPSSERRRLHSRLGKRLVDTARSNDDPRLLEAVRHFRAAGARREISRHGLTAARYLKASYQSRMAIDVFHQVLDALPRGALERRVEIAVEVADLHSKTGSLDEGILVLQEINSQLRLSSPRLRARVVFWLATLHGRRGDFQHADRLFRRGFDLSKRIPLPRTERLFFLNELAAMKAVLGQCPEALELCAEGLREAGRSRDPRLREVALSLHATRASVALRDHDYAAAVRGLETALEIAEALGSRSNQATILNNLGVVHAACDGYAEAIRMFRDAEKICRMLDEGPSLASIHGNLAILHAKTGDFPSMESAFEAGELLVPASVGKREALSLTHARGLSLLTRGRFSDARVHLEDAIRRAKEVGDRHLAAFDEVYRCEALIFLADHATAGKELDRLASEAEVPRVRRMALARAAFAAAWTSNVAAVDEAATAHAASAGAPVPYLDAWDGLFIGWALSLCGARSRAIPHVSSALEFFEGRGLRPAASLARYVAAESRLLDSGSGGSGTCPLDCGALSDLTAVLSPLLLARECFAKGGSVPDPVRCADLLAAAGAALVGNPMPEWSVRLEALRAALRGDGAAFARVERERKDLAARLPADRRAAYLQGAHWRRWTRALKPRRLDSKEPAKRSSRVSAEKTSREADTGTVALARHGESPAGSRVIGRSASMRRLVAMLERLRASDLPVLITGETGSGKELVARAIHEGSRRASKPFTVVDCATIPAEILEAELFGARRGSFTGITEDRKGMLAEAEGGTVFVDEIGEASPEVQRKLLRVISTGSVRPLGAAEERRVNVRFLFSTAKNLDDEVKAGRFREDLLHRVRVVSAAVPPLRERPEDMAELVTALLGEMGEPAVVLGDETLARLRGQPWPGNVRELRNLLARARLEHGKPLTAEAVGRALDSWTPGEWFPAGLLAREDLPVLKDRLEREFIVFHYKRLGGDTTALGRLLSLKRRQLYRRCERLGIRLRDLR